MASKRREIVISRISKKIFKCEEGNNYISLILDISASRKARNFFQKSKYNYIEKSTLWAQSGFCSSNRLEMASKRVNLVQN